MQIDPAEPTTTDDLVVTHDGGGELVWSRDGIDVATGETISGELTHKGELWRVQARRGSTVLAEASVEIQNTAPVITLTAPETVEDAQPVTPVLEVEDIDGDAIDWSAQWTAEGADTVRTLGLPSWATEGEALWTLQITASDGEADVTATAQTRVLPRPNPGEHLFDDTVVHSIRLTLDEAAQQSLRDAPTAWVHGDIEIDGTAIADVGVRLKGRGSFQPLDNKPSLRVELDRWIDGQEYDGLDELVLNNMAVDPSRLRERLAYGVYRDLGVPAARAAHATLELGGEPYGLYSLVESVDGRFLERWFRSADGPLYELGGVEFTIDQIASFDHDGGPDDPSGLIAIADALAVPGVRLYDLDEILDVDAFIRYFAVSAAIGQFDAYPWSFPGDDLYVYIDPKDGRARFAAHGADETFSDPFRPVDYVYGLLGRTCTEDPICHDAWAAEVWRTTEHLESGVADRVALINAQIEPYLAADTRGGVEPDLAGPAQEGVAAFITGRRARLELMPGMW